MQNSLITGETNELEELRKQLNHRLWEPA